jgi:hypothetical protein
MTTILTTDHVLTTNKLNHELSIIRAIYYDDKRSDTEKARSLKPILDVLNYHFLNLKIPTNEGFSRKDQRLLNVYDNSKNIIIKAAILVTTNTTEKTKTVAEKILGFLTSLSLYA